MNRDELERVQRTAVELDPQRGIYYTLQPMRLVPHWTSDGCASPQWPDGGSEALPSICRARIVGYGKSNTDMVLAPRSELPPRRAVLRQTHPTPARTSLALFWSAAQGTAVDLLHSNRLWQVRHGRHAHPDLETAAAGGAVSNAPYPGSHILSPLLVGCGSARWRAAWRRSPGQFRIRMQLWPAGYFKPSRTRLEAAR